jgi:hypothetical protein
MPADEIAAGIRRTSQDLDAFRVAPRNDFAALVMTPQVLAFRKAEADTLRKYFNPGSSTTIYCDGNGPCDPLEALTGIGDYLNERRAVVMIQVTPAQLLAPRRGEHAKPNMARKPVLARVQLLRDGTPVTAIEEHRIYSVVNPGDYPADQQQQLYSGVSVFNPNDLVQGRALELNVLTVGGRGVRIPIPAAVLEGIRRDLASVLR